MDTGQLTQSLIVKLKNMKIAEISINYKPLEGVTPIQKIKGSKDGVEFFRAVWSDRMEYIEEVYMLLLNRCNSILGFVKVSEGGTSAAVIDTKIVFQAALKANAQSIVLCHNHPSGNCAPSEADIQLTKKIKEAGKILELALLDHIIITKNSYYSFADEGQS